jgi:hypothetical protein
MGLGETGITQEKSLEYKENVHFRENLAKNRAFQLT